MKLEYTLKEVILKVENVNLRYGDKQILRDINFEIHDVVRPNMCQGQIVSVIGRSGIGKTQLFKIISGLIKPNSGTIKIDIDQHPLVTGEVGVVYQNYVLFNHRTIFSNLKIGLDNVVEKKSESEKKEIINDYAEKFDIIEHLRKYPAQLSGGQRQRVSIIQQILTGNKFILLDEPFSGLDIIMVGKVVNLLNKIACANEYNTLVIVSHDIANSLAISDTALILAQEAGKPGATIIEKIDLMSMGLAWTPDIKSNPEFQKLVLNMAGKI